MSEREIERWTREVAENPGAASFVPLARAYRAQGRREAARHVVLRGLEHNPQHINGHALLALVYVEDGERQKAGDEWETILRLDPGNFDASRGLGFLALERGDLRSARRHLGQAAAVRPDDPAVRQALEVLRRREAAGRAAEPGRAGSATAEPRRAGSAAYGARGAGGRATGSADGVGAGAGVGRDGAARDGVAATRTAAGDPTRLFDVLSSEAPFLGAVVLDRQGMVLAGALDLDGIRGDLLGALINTAVMEARRTASLVGLEQWEGLLLDCDEATVHVAGLPEGAVVLMAARSGAPAGWAVRTAERATTLARSFLEGRS